MVVAKRGVDKGMYAWKTSVIGGDKVLLFGNVPQLVANAVGS
jgi:hypothetical protein